MNSAQLLILEGPIAGYDYFIWIIGLLPSLTLIWGKAFEYLKYTTIITKKDN